MSEYTLAFIFRGDNVLMLRRNKAPNAFLLNGVGGKTRATTQTPATSILPSLKVKRGTYAYGRCSPIPITNSGMTVRFSSMMGLNQDWTANEETHTKPDVLVEMN